MRQVRRVVALLEDDLRDDRELEAGILDAGEPVDVDRDLVARVELPDPLEDLTTDEQGAGNLSNVLALKQAWAHPRRRRLPRGEEEADQSDHTGRLGALSKDLRLRAQLSRGPAIVAVQEPDQIAVAGLHALIPALRQARLVLRDVGDLRIRARDLGRSVGRLAVDDDQLEARVPLGQHAVDRLGEPGLAVLDGEDHGDPGELRAHAASASPMCFETRSGSMPSWRARWSSAAASAFLPAPLRVSPVQSAS